MTATIGTVSLSMRSMMECACCRRRSTAAASVMPRNSPMSAPAMKPLFLPERSTTPLGGSRSMRVRTSLSSPNTSSLSVLALAPDLSKISQAMRLSSRTSFQCRHCLPAPGTPASGRSLSEYGPSSILRGARTFQTLPMGRALYRLDQHGAALPAADALGRYPPAHAKTLHGVDQMQDDAVAACADRMANPDGAAVDIEPVALDAPCRLIEMQQLATEGVVLPGGKAGEHLRGEGFVQFPERDVAERKAVPAQDFRSAQHRSEPHDGGFERRPLAVDDHRARRKAVLLDRLLGGEDHPGGPIGDLRAVAGGHLSPRPLEGRLELGELLDGAVGAHAVIMVIDPAVAGERRLDLACEAAFLLRAGEPLLALDRITIGVGPRYPEEMGQYLGGLSHVELDQRIGEPALEANDRLEKRGAEAEGRYQPRGDIARAQHARVPVDCAAAEQERRLAQRFRSARENEIAMPGADISVCDVDRLHAGAAIDLDRESGHVVAHAEPQSRHARRVHLLGGHADAAEDDLVEGIRWKRLAQQQRTPTGNRKINRRERTRPAARPDEGSAAAVNNEDRTRCYSAAVGRGIACDGMSPRDCRRVISSGAKSSTATASATACAAACSAAASLSLMTSCRRAASMSLILALCRRSCKGAAAIVSSNARSRRAMPLSPVPWKMPAVRRSRVAEGASRSPAQACVSRSEEPRRRTPNGSSMKRSSQATGRMGRLARISSRRVSMVAELVSIDQATSGRSAAWRPSSSQRLSTAEPR